MKNSKKLTLVLLSTLFICMLALGLLGCSKGNSSLNNDHTHDYTTINYNQYYHWLECGCGEKSAVEFHKGGNAYCTKQAKCEVCEQSYGEIGSEHIYLNGNCIDCTETSLECFNFTLLSNNTYEITVKNKSELPYEVKIPSFYNEKPVTSIGSSAFAGCTYLVSIKIPDSVTEIYNTAFSDCNNLRSIIVSENNLNYCSLNGNLYNKEKTVLIQYAIGKMDTIFTIPNSVTTIGSYAFADCSYLTLIEIPNSVNSIGECAFMDCHNLTSLDIPVGVTAISDSTFYCCESLTMVEIPNSVTSIGDHAFYCCAKLTSLDIPVGVTTIGDYAFSCCYSLTLINIPVGVTTIGDYAFSCCYSLTSINIPVGVTTIGDSTFYYCYGLISIKIPAGVTCIGEYAFYSCDELTSIKIPDGVTTICDYAFSSCGDLIFVVIPNSVVTVGKFAFYSCTNLALIQYAGTQEEWNKITKSSSWDLNTGDYIITYDYTSE